MRLMDIWRGSGGKIGGGDEGNVGDSDGDGDVSDGG